MQTVVDARKERFDSTAAWDLLKEASKITAAKGKKVAPFDPKTEEKEEILSNVMGPSGNLRAPTLKIGNQFIVGFHPDLYEECIE